ncbi:MAG: hypothetical protein MUE97_03575 [Phycisphaerales bacterium]|jgi:hypothetical protein|nr:hypothetical protein [Phycisphaerales bacterium]
MSYRASPTDQTGSKNKIIAIVAVVTLILALSMIALFLTLPAPTPPPDNRPGVQFVTSLGAAMQKDERVFANVSIRPTEDGLGAVVSGTVPTEADMAKLKAVLDSGTPKVNVTMNVTVKR